MEKAIDGWRGHHTPAFAFPATEDSAQGAAPPVF